MKPNRLPKQTYFLFFGLEIDEPEGSETLDISTNDEGSAILQAVSVMVQANRSIGDLSELLAKISADLKEDGTVSNAALLKELRKTAKELKLADIRSKLEQRYDELAAVQ
jgi:hypothetical protein